jgi:hypothetical protein
MTAGHPPGGFFLLRIPDLSGFNDFFRICEPGHSRKRLSDRYLDLSVVFATITGKRCRIRIDKMGAAAEDISMELIGEGESFRHELADMVESAQMFSDFARQDTETIAAYARAYSVKKDTAIFREGGKGAFMCLVVDGRVDVFKENHGDSKRRITTIRPGKTMGEMALLDELPHSATTVAVEDTTLVLITKFHFDRLNEEHPALGNRILRKIAKLLSLRLRQTTGILSDYLE